MVAIETEDVDLTSEGRRFWTRDALHEVVERTLGGRQFIVVSNGEPYVHRFEGEEIVCARPISGLVAALDPVLRAVGGTWVAHGSGNADRDVVDAHDRVRVPPDDPRYTLRRVWLSVADEDDYYYGFANQALCMGEVDRRARMAALPDTVTQNNIFRWAGKMVRERGRIAARRILETAG